MRNSYTLAFGSTDCRMLWFIGSMSNSFHHACPFLSLFGSNFHSLRRTHPTDGHHRLVYDFFIYLFFQSILHDYIGLPIEL